MKLFCVFIVSLCFFMDTEQVQEYGKKPALNQIFKLLLPTPSCEYQLVEPLDALLYAEQEKWTEVCNGSEVYFQGCRDPTLLDCEYKSTLTEAACTNYMYWIDAFVAGGRRFTCDYGYENITDISVNHDGHKCTYEEVNSDLSTSVDNIKSFLSTPKYIQCSDVQGYMNATLKVLDDCKDKSMMNLVQEYFEQVLQFSPCPDSEIAPGVGALSAANTMLIISTFLIFAAISFNS